MFSFRKCQEPVRRETTEGSSIEFIGYRIPQYERMVARSYSQGSNQRKCVGLFRFSDWLSRNPHLKVELLKICETCCVNGRHAKNVLNLKFPTHFGLSLSLECSGEISRQSVEFAYPINSLKVDMYSSQNHMRDHRL